MLWKSIHYEIREKSFECGDVLSLHLKYMESTCGQIQVVALWRFHLMDIIQDKNHNAHMFECPWVKFGDISFPGFKDTGQSVTQLVIS